MIQITRKAWMWIAVIAAIGIAAGTGAALTFGPSATDNNTMRQNTQLSFYTATDEPYGKSYAEYTSDWWVWNLSDPNIAADQTGEYANKNQNDPNVLYFGGTPGGIVAREWTVAEGKSLLACVICGFCSDKIDGTQTEEEFKSCIVGYIDNVKKVEVYINGDPLPESQIVRIRSGVFDLPIPDDNVYGAPGGVHRAMSDGYWIFIKESQSAEIRKVGTLTSVAQGYNFAADVTTKITVVGK